MSPARVRGIAAKRAFERNTVNPALCLSGHELVAERRHIGDGTSFRFDGAAHKLSWLDARILCAIAYAMLCRYRHGLIATLAELGHHAGFRTTAIGDSTRKLKAWALVVVDPHFVDFGAVTNQRGNVYRITSQCAQEFALHAPAGVVLPEGTPDPTWVRRSRIARVRGSRNPEANPELGRKRENISRASGMAAALPARLEEAASPGIFPEPSALPGAAPVPPGLPRVKARRDAFPEGFDGEGVDEIRAIVSEDLRELVGDAWAAWCRARGDS